MKRFSAITMAMAAVVMVLMALAPTAGLADSRQKNKNLWRNGAIAGGAVALYGLHSHNTATTVAGVAGAAYSANRYEQDRRSQSRAKAARARMHRHHHHYRHHHR